MAKQSDFINNTRITETTIFKKALARIKDTSHYVWESADSDHFNHTSLAYIDGVCDMAQELLDELN